MERKIKKKVNDKNVKSVNKKINSTKKDNNKVKTKKKNLKPIIIVDYIFLVSLALTIIFGIQTNTIFFMPFVIVLIITLICMGIILVNAIYGKIKKRMKKDKKVK